MMGGKSVVNFLKEIQIFVNRFKQYNKPAVNYNLFSQELDSMMNIDFTEGLRFELLHQSNKNFLANCTSILNSSGSNFGIGFNYGSPFGICISINL